MTRLRLYWKSILGAVFVLLACATILAWVSSRFRSFEGWDSIFICLLLSSAIALGAWWLLRRENPPRWLGALVLGAIVVRLAAGLFWGAAMPLWGHNTSAEKAGYIMADAYARDQSAWKLAKSEKPLWTAFEKNRKVDQYGGLLFLSALVYRYLGSGFHQPLLILILAATISSLAILFTWAFARRGWDEQVAWLAAWILAFYPEAVLLGSSQMREAFTITFTVASFYGLLRYQADRSWTSLGWLIVPLLLCLPFSPLFAALLTVLLAVTAIITGGAITRDALRQRWLWLALGGLILLVMVGLWFSLKQFTPEGMNNPVEMVNWWLIKSARFQAYLSRHASGWLQKVFKQVPEWSRFPILVGYGVVQPFLPAALTVGSRALIWPWITLIRAVGWAAMLLFLIYAPLLAATQKSKHRLAIALCVVVWTGILVASYRSGGDLWDNPRYRATFAGLQAALAAWAWVEHRRQSDPWLRRALLAAAAILGWFLPWYLQRYTSFNWPITDFFTTLGLGFVSACVLVFWDWARTRRKVI